MSWAEVSRINSNIQKPLDTLIGEGVRTVKSIQRGTATFYVYNPGIDMNRVYPPTINLSAVNPAKCEVKLSGFAGQTRHSTVTHNEYAPVLPHVAGLTAAQLSVGASPGFNNDSSSTIYAENSLYPFSWEVVEYY